MLRCAKGSSGVIMEIGNDEGQTGLTQSGNTWCDWTIEESALPAFAEVVGADPRAMRFKENVAGDGIELRVDQDVIDLPNG